MVSPHRRNNRCPAFQAITAATAIAALIARPSYAARQNTQLQPQRQQRQQQGLQPFHKNLRATGRRSTRSDVTGFIQSGQLTAGDIDDNLNFGLYLKYKQKALSKSNNAQTRYPLPDVGLSDRVPILVLDSDRTPFSNAVVEVRDDLGRVIAELPAGTNGRTTLFPSIDATDGLLAEGRQANMVATPINPSSWKITARPPEGSCPDDCGEAIGVEILAAVNEGVSARQWAGGDAVLVPVPKKSMLPRQLDLALVLDTTGSMCDELAYLQSELRGVITSVVDNTHLPANVETVTPGTDPIACTEDAKECPDGSWVGRWADREHGCAFRPCPGERRRVERQGQGQEGGDTPVDVRVGIVSYRDHGDDYVVRTAPFSNSNDAVASLVKESCGGGGDYPEAMDEALETTSDLKWADGNVARVALLLADAPPHAEDYQRTLQAALELRRKGVRVYGIAASGVADEAEYMMRLMSLVTGARYAWLTDDSGIGNPHAEPKVKCYQVTRLDMLLVRLLRSELTGMRIEAGEDDIIREVGSQEKGVCIVDFQGDDSSPPTYAPTKSPLYHNWPGPGPIIGPGLPEAKPALTVSVPEAATEGKEASVWAGTAGTDSAAGAAFALSVDGADAFAVSFTAAKPASVPAAPASVLTAEPTDGHVHHDLALALEADPATIESSEEALAVDSPVLTSGGGDSLGEDTFTEAATEEEFANESGDVEGAGLSDGDSIGDSDVVSGGVSGGDSDGDSDGDGAGDGAVDLADPALLPESTHDHDYIDEAVPATPGSSEHNETMSEDDGSSPIPDVAEGPTDEHGEDDQRHNEAAGEPEPGSEVEVVPDEGASDVVEAAEVDSPAPSPLLSNMFHCFTVVISFLLGVHMV